MSGLILPPGVKLPAPIVQRDSPDEGEAASSLPEPQGWKILCIVPEVSDRYENSSLIKDRETMRQEEYGTTVLFVLKVGPLAYKDPDKFPDGKPWCKAGDFILTRTYSGTRIKIFGKELRLINDDMVDATVEDPRGISRFSA